MSACRFVPHNQGLRYEDVTLPEAAEGEADHPEVVELSRLGRKPVGEKCGMGNVKLQTRRSSMLKAGSSVENWSRWQLTANHRLRHACTTQIYGNVQLAVAKVVIFISDRFSFSQLPTLLNLTRMVIQTEVRFDHTYQDGLLDTATEVVFSIEEKQLVANEYNLTYTGDCVINTWASCIWSPSCGAQKSSIFGMEWCGALCFLVGMFMFRNMFF